MQNSINQEPVYVTYIITVTNRIFPPDSYRTKVNLFYDSNVLRYVKNENTFWLKDHKPVIVLTDTGLHIDFGMIPAAYLGSPRIIILYFIPLKNSDAVVSGEFLTKELEYYYGPRHKTVVRPINPLKLSIQKSFTPAGEPSPDFKGLIKKNGIYYATDTADGDFTQVYIPSHMSIEDAIKSFFRVAGDNKFIKTGEVQCPDGISYTFHRIETGKKYVFELRATFERGKYENNLYLFMCSNVKVREYFEAIDRQFRERLK